MRNSAVVTVVLLSMPVAAQDNRLVIGHRCIGIDDRLRGFALTEGFRSWDLGGGSQD